MTAYSYGYISVRDWQMTGQIKLIVEQNSVYGIDLFSNTMTASELTPPKNNLSVSGVARPLVRATSLLSSAKSGVARRYIA